MAIVLQEIQEEIMIDGNAIQYGDVDFTVNLEQRTVTGTFQTVRGPVVNRILEGLGDPLAGYARKLTFHELRVRGITGDLPDFVRSYLQARVLFRLEKFRRNGLFTTNSMDEFSFSFFGSVHEYEYEEVRDVQAVEE